MTTLAPVLDLVGDIGDFSCFVYGSSRWVAYLRQSGELELHRSGDGITEFIGINVPYPKSQISVAVLDDTLRMAWTHRTTQEIYFSTWNLLTRKYVQQPTLLWTGSSPALARHLTTKLIMSYRDTSGQHVYRISEDGGAVWSSPTVVYSATTVTEIGIDVYPATDHRVFWAETAEDI